MDDQVSDEELVAFLDGELDAARFASVEALLNEDPELAERAAALATSAMRVREAFEEIVREPVPSRVLLAATAREPAPATAEILPFRAKLTRFGREHPRAPRQWLPLAAAAAMVGIVFGSSIGYVAGTPGQGAGVLDSVTGAHNLLMASANAGEPAVFDVPAGAEQKLPNDIHIPDMKPYGLAFQGARKMVVDGGKLAYEFYYTGAKKDPGPITVTVWKTTKADLSPSFERRDNVNVMYWRQGGHGYAIVGEADKGYMVNMSQDIAWQLRGN